MDDEDFGTLVRQHRSDVELTQAELAARMGIDRSTVARIENGEVPSLSVLGRLANTLGLDETARQNLLMAALRTVPGGFVPEGVVGSAQVPSSFQSSRRLRVFLCHSSGDKDSVRDLYRWLQEAGIQSWLDEEDLIPGQIWATEIPRAVRASDIVLVCLSQASINKRGYVQKEIKYALDAADEQPENTIFLIPVRLEECDVPERLQHLQRVDLFHEQGHAKLLLSLQARAKEIEIAQRDSDRAEQQRREEMRRMEMANIQVSLRQEPGRPSRSGRPRTNNYLDIVNNGPAFAHNVVLGTFEPKQAGADRPGVVRDAFPVRELGPGETISCPLQIWGYAFEAEVSWDDPRGPQRRIFTVTRG